MVALNLKYIATLNSTSNSKNIENWWYWISWEFRISSKIVNEWDEIFETYAKKFVQIQKGTSNIKLEF